MKRQDIKDLLESKQFDQPVHTKGWIRGERGNAYVRFLGLNDGSSLQNIQVVADAEKFDENLWKRFNVGAAVSVTGTLVESKGKGQSVEIIADSIEILGDVDAEKYPIQPRAHSMEFLRENAHLRSRTTTFGAIFRLRHALSFAIHQYFNDRRFYYWHSPILTASDAEGAGEIFRVTTLSYNELPEYNFEDISFDKETKWGNFVYQQPSQLQKHEYKTNFYEVATPVGKHAVIKPLKNLIENYINNNDNFQDALKHFFNFISKDKSYVNKISGNEIEEGISFLMKQEENSINNIVKIWEKYEDKNNKKLIENHSNIFFTQNDTEIVDFIKENFEQKFNREQSLSSISFYIQNPIAKFCLSNWKLSESNDITNEFFGQPTNLTVSGQLEAELGALGLGRVYTFGPTFRAENSNTARHLAEFWMIEPEMAFYDLKDNMDLVEDFLKYLIKYALDNYREEIEFLDAEVCKRKFAKEKRRTCRNGIN